MNGTRTKVCFLHLVLAPRNNFETAVLSAAPIERPGALNLRDPFAVNGADSEWASDLLNDDGTDNDSALDPEEALDLLAVDGAVVEVVLTWSILPGHRVSSWAAHVTERGTMRVV